MLELSKAIDFDPEGSMFCAYSSKVDALARFALGLKEFVMIPTLCKTCLAEQSWIS